MNLKNVEEGAVKNLLSISNIEVNRHSLLSSTAHDVNDLKSGANAGFIVHKPTITTTERLNESPTTLMEKSGQLFPSVMSPQMTKIMHSQTMYNPSGPVGRSTSVKKAFGMELNNRNIIVNSREQSSTFMALGELNNPKTRKGVFF